MAGSTNFGLYANPAPDPYVQTVAAYHADDWGHRDAYSLAAKMGVQHQREIFTWSDLEPASGVYDFAYLDRFVKGTRGSIILSVDPVDGGSTYRPADLAGDAWDSAALTTAFSNFITALTAHVPSARLLMVLVGNEIDSYFRTHSAEIAAYATFLGDAKAAIHTAFGAGVLVTASFTFSATADYATYAAITAVQEFPVWTYYGIDYSQGDYSVLTANLGNDWTTMFNLNAASNQFMLQEAGCPSDASLGGSAATQAAFLDAVAFVAGQYAGAGVRVIVSWSWLNDLSAPILSALGLAGNLRAFEGSLGAQDASGSRKATFVHALTQMFNSHPGGRSSVLRPLQAGVQP